jgi:hypothetical protein
MQSRSTSNSTANATNIIIVGAPKFAEPNLKIWGLKRCSFDLIYFKYRMFSKLRRFFQHVIVCVILKSFSQNHLSKMCTAMNIQ